MADTNDFHTALVAEARRRVNSAISAMVSWQIHVSYHSKTGLLAEFDTADAVLLALRAAEIQAGLVDVNVGYTVVAGVNRTVFRTCRDVVKNRVGNAYYNLPDFSGLYVEEVAA